MGIPDFLESYRADAHRLLEEGAIRDVLFSGPTYQIELRSRREEKSAWVFLGLEEDLVRDLFCDCSSFAQKGSCVHMAAAFLFVFSHGRVPLHLQFERSFWRALFFDLFKKCGAFEPTITWKDDSFTIHNSEGKLLVEGTGNVRNFFKKRPSETEETSIKFSNLSDEELEYWRQSRPSELLRFELSPFSDFAKDLFLRSFEEAPKILFSPITSLPKKVTCDFPKLHFSRSLDAEALTLLIPTLNTVPSNCSFFAPGQFQIESAVFHEKEGTVAVKRRQQAVPQRGRKVFGEYLFVPGVGFARQEGEAAEKFLLDSPDEISEFLTHNRKLLEKSGIAFDTKVRPLSYDLFFDSERRFHIRSYLFQTGDILHKFGEWVFISGRGFFKIGPSKFTEAEVVIDPDNIASFLQSSRQWLRAFDGFEVHLARVAEKISYSVAPDGSLTFRLETHRARSSKEIDLGKWVWRQNEGFFLKESALEVRTLPIDEPIAAHRVADFIRRNRDLLDVVKEFFGAPSPIKSIGLSISLKKRGLIEIAPDYEWFSPSDSIGARFYDEFVFLPGRGFAAMDTERAPLGYIREISSDNSVAWNHFFLEFLPKLKAEYRCRVDRRLEKALDLALVMSPEGQIERSRFDVDLFFRSGNRKVSVAALLPPLTRGERFIPTEAGVIDTGELRFGWLKGVPRKGWKRKKGFRLNTADLFYLNAYEKPEFDFDTGQKIIFEKILALEEVEKPDLHAFRCQLRPYQEMGIAWLWFLHENGLSGLLCDEMGVGKTHQAMGLLAAARAASGKKESRPLFLVACPTSLIFHWQEKLASFLPEMRVRVYAGSARTIADVHEGSFDLVLTSYGILRNESTRFSELYFDVAIFDELQIAKNHISQIYAALIDIRAHMKVGLTGTPIENELRELKALFDIVLPGYMPPEEDFRDLFAAPIEKEADSSRRELFSKFSRPFVLRRRKIDVCSDLPEKQEMISYAALVGEQKSLYNQVAAARVAPLLEILNDEGAPIPYMHIFALISSLKQISNHPAAYLRDVENFERYESGKWDLFRELIEEAQESGEKVVVFSQYLAMLDIIERWLGEQHIGFAAIRGATKARGQEVFRFQNDPRCQVFLGSLGASGLGIDLTAASIVIHYDRWWNPARENQATDRVHRIGQMRGVEVFKLVTRDTIEEHIDRLIERKRALFEDIVSFDDSRIMKRLDRRDLLSLLSGLGQNG
jgi:superfamily II DNA or RNA helicase